MDLNLGCGPYRAEGWHNVDVTNARNHAADQLIRPGEPLPWGDNAYDRTYLGHVLEHLPWVAPPGMLSVFDVLAEVRRVTRDEVCVVGPDVLKVIRRWHEGLEDESLIVETMEHDEHFQAVNGWWPEARHWWNCWEERVVHLLEVCGFRDVESVPIEEETLAGWPLVAFTQHQFALVAVP